MKLLYVCILLLLSTSSTFAVTLQNRVNTIIATAQSKPTVEEKLEVINTWANNILDHAKDRADYESTGNIPKLETILNFRGDDHGSLAVGLYGAAALKCGVLLQAGVDPNKLVWTDIVDLDISRPRTVVFFIGNTITWVLDTRKDSPWEWSNENAVKIMYSPNSVYRCDDHTASTALRGIQ